MRPASAGRGNGQPRQAKTLKSPEKQSRPAGARPGGASACSPGRPAAPGWRIAQRGESPTLAGAEPGAARQPGRGARAGIPPRRDHARPEGALLRFLRFLRAPPDLRQELDDLKRKVDARPPTPPPPPKKKPLTQPESG